MVSVYHHVKEVCAPDRLGGLRIPIWFSRLPLLAGLCLLLLPVSLVWAAPFDRDFTFPLPDGQSITLHGRGDDFSAVFETLDGYTVVFDQASRLYHYAIQGADGRLASSGLVAGVGDPAAAGVVKHLRADAAVAGADRRERAVRWEAETGIRQRWNGLKAQQRAVGAAQLSGGIMAEPPTQTTIGNKVGLTLLVDFSDQPGTIPSSSVDGFLNGDSYSGFGNNGSVKSYFSGNSGGKLRYTNVLVGYVRVPQPKTYYDNPSGDPLQFVQDAVAAMKALPNFDTTIRPLLDTLTVDSSNQVVAFNIYYAGTCASPWSLGLWPHSWSLPSPVDLWQAGKKVCNYQMSDMGTSLAIGTFCHENGHMLCGFPDIYDYGYDSIGGAGDFCLMDTGAVGPFEKNPAQVCAYLKLAAGWGSTVTDVPATAQTFSLPAAGSSSGNVFLRYRNPAAPDTEYFVIENRRKGGRDALLPASGLAIWHVDELGDRDNQSLGPNTMHLNYEVSLEQADNQFDFQNNTNSGDARDLFYLGNSAAGYTNQFNDTSGPSAKWWSGAGSKLHVYNISAAGATMTFNAFAGDGSEATTIQFGSATCSARRDAGSATISVTRTGDTTKTMSVGYTTSDGTAVAGTDYTAASGTLTFAPGEIAKTFSVPVSNAPHTPGDVTVNLTLSRPTGGAILSNSAAAVLTIIDTIPVLQFSAATYTVNRDVGTAAVTITRQGAAGDVSISYSATDGTAVAGTDYTAVSGTVTFAPSDASKMIEIPILNSVYRPGDKTVNLFLNGPTGGAVAGSPIVALLNIHDNQSPPDLSISDLSMNEGDIGTTSFDFPVTLSKPSSLPISIHYQTIDGTGAAGRDYAAVDDTLVIPPLQAGGVISVPVTGDTMYEPNRTFSLLIDSPSGAIIRRGTAQGTILNDDPLPSVSIEDAVSSGSDVAFMVRLSAASTLPVTFQYQTVDGTAIAGRHYKASSGFFTVPAGKDAVPLSIPVLPTSIYEEDKTFEVKLSNPSQATLARSQAQGTVHSSVGLPSLTIEEGVDLGRFLTFRMKLSAASELPVTVYYETMDGTATAGTYYTPVNGYVTIPAGQTFTEVIVPIVSHPQDGRTLFLVPGVTSNASLATSAAAGTIESVTPASDTTPVVPNISCGAGAGSATLLCCLTLAILKWGRGSTTIQRVRQRASRIDRCSGTQR